MPKPQPITILIDVLQLEKPRFFKSKDGKRLYCSLVAWPNRDGADEYGNTHYVTQGKNRDENVKMPILGNLRLPNAGTPPPAPTNKPASRPRPPADPALDVQDDDVPF